MISFVVVKLSQWVEIFPISTYVFLLVLFLVDGSLVLLLLWLLWFGNYLLLSVMHGCTKELFHGQRRALDKDVVHFDQ